MTNKHDSAIIFLYTGEYGVVTDSSGLYYMRARYYDPTIKRFINQDVLTGSITDSPTLNRYAYVNGNPISLSDPFGLSPILNWLSNLNGHAVLDLLGMIPGAGFVFDLANAAWYAAEGNYTDAIMCGISALPGLGDAFGPMLKSGKAACAIRTFLHTADNLSSIGQSLYGMYVSGSNIANAIVDGENVSVGDVLGFAMSAVSLSHAAKDLGTSYCFVGDTPVWTSEGLKPIEDIQIGDEVLSEDETTGEIGLKKVYDISINETDEFYHIHVNGEEIVATGTHPFYVYKFGWTTARALKAGDVLVLSNGRHVVVEWVDHEITESPVLVYNFEVEDFHTYFVGESGILVHNGKYGAAGQLGCGTSASKSAESSADTSTKKGKRWKVGDPIDAPTAKGNAPKWSTVQKRYWKNESHYNPGAYDQSNLSRMKKGRAPLVQYQENGKWYSMELHHKNIPQREGGSHSLDNLEALTPWEHAAKDKYRHFKP